MPSSIESRAFLALMILTLVPTVAASQTRPFRVYISADMEGTAGVVSLAQVRPADPDYANSRVLMLGEVNAAIVGAFNAGATEVVVNDSHGSHMNLLPDQLDSRAQLVRGAPAPFGMVVGLDSTFDAVLLIGYHARASTAEAILSHTYSLDIRRVRLNGVEVGEFGLSAAVAGAFHVPVVFVSGDQALAKEAHALVPGVQALVVKEAITRTVARSLSPAVARDRITAGVKAALQHRSTIAPLRLEAPVRLEMEVMDDGMADELALIPGTQRVDALTVRYTAPTVSDAYIISRLMAALTRPTR